MSIPPPPKHTHKQTKTNPFDNRQHTCTCYNVMMVIFLHDIKCCHWIKKNGNEELGFLERGRGAVDITKTKIQIMFSTFFLVSWTWIGSTPSQWFRIPHKSWRSRMQRCWYEPVIHWQDTSYTMYHTKTEQAPVGANTVLLTNNLT